MKKAIKTIFNIIAWAVLIFALLITLLVFTGERNNGVSNLLGYIPLTVESNSMHPTFDENDLILCREIDDIAKLEKGDVITFWTIIDGKRVKNTHRITAIDTSMPNISFTTCGDNNNGENDRLAVSAGDVIGKWTGLRLKGFGKAVNFLRTKTGFFLCIVMPLALFFLFELYKFIVTMIEVKRPALTAADEEEIKRRAVEEYLKEQAEKQENKNDDET